MLSFDNMFESFISEQIRRKNRIIETNLSKLGDQAHIENLAKEGWKIATMQGSDETYLIPPNVEDFDVIRKTCLRLDLK
jgi:hypothetical protein